MTDLAPLTDKEEKKKNDYIKKKLNEFEYYNEPKGMEIKDIIELIKKKNDEGY
jgi:hypothetical protein